MKRRYGLIALLMFLTISFVKLDVSATILAAHRGYSSKYKENTITAFQKAYSNGFDALEMDVWENKQGELLIFHDTNMKKLQGVNMNIWELPTAKRASYRYKIPTVEEVFKVAKSHSGKLYMHIKYVKGKYHLSQKGVDKLAKLVKKYNLQNRVVILAEQNMITKYKRSTFKYYMLSCNPKTLEQLKTYIKWCKDNKMTHILYVYCDTYSLLGSKATTLAHNAGLRVGVYTTETQAQFNMLKKYKADLAISNYKLKK